jgi:mannose-6-phosphate isomerase
MKVAPHIVKTRPFLVQKVWGGRRLETRFGKALPDEKPYGEAWEIADLDEGQCLVDSGPLMGRPLKDLVRRWGRELVGNRAPREDQFPLLVKLLDANRDLSVQVHPGQEEAARMPGADSKEETWLILDVEDEGAIIHGLTEHGIKAQDFRQAVEQGVVQELLQRIPVAAGDVVHVSPGTIHAICAGVALLEIQEPSDTTYRVYDYDRPGLDGEPRQLHLEEALEVGHLGRSDEIIRRNQAGVDDELVRDVAHCGAYRIERLSFEANRALRWTVNPDSPQILHVLNGALTVSDGLGGTMELGPYDSAVVPASMKVVDIQSRQAGEVIVAGLAVERLVDELSYGKLAELVP